MEEKSARALFPVWADEDEPVKEYTPRNSRTETRPRQSRNLRTAIADAASDFIRRNLIAILIIVAFALEGWIVAVYTEHRVAKEVRQTVEAEMRQGFAAYLEEQEQKRQAEAFLTGDASRQAAITELGEKLTVHAAGLRQDRKVTKAGAETYLWVDIARWLSGLYGKTIDDILEGPVENYDKNHPVREEDREIGMRVAEAVMTGNYPNGFTTDLQFAEINADGSVTARSKLKTDSTTVFWHLEG